ncbi:tetratricopeptide repeat protein, partial [Haliangium sp. UPWRP_2]|uniref:tetratricopeptide repeat protein n=1 Tax=Haliangium sp. UPWRP_2 TaxID=1931276 RepID=UPI0013049355
MNAKDLSRAGKLLAAIVEYEAAYREIQLPVFLYNIGRLHHRLGNHEQAANYYHRFLSAAVDDDPEQRARAEEYLKQVEPRPPTSVSSAAPGISAPPPAPGAHVFAADSPSQP